MNNSGGTAQEVEGALPVRICGGEGHRFLLSFCPHSVLQGKISTCTCTIIVLLICLHLSSHLLCHTKRLHSVGDS